MADSSPGCPPPSLAPDRLPPPLSQAAVTPSPHTIPKHVNPSHPTPFPNHRYLPPGPGGILFPTHHSTNNHNIEDQPCVPLRYPPPPFLPPLPWLVKAWGHCQGSGVKQRLECTATSVASPRHLGFIRWPKIGFGGVRSVWRKGCGRKEGGRGRQGVAFKTQRGPVTKLLLLLCSLLPQQSSS